MNLVIFQKIEDILRTFSEIMGKYRMLHEKLWVLKGREEMIVAKIMSTYKGIFHSQNHISKCIKVFMKYQSVQSCRLVDLEHYWGTR